MCKCETGAPMIRSYVPRLHIRLAAPAGFYPGKSGSPPLHTHVNQQECFTVVQAGMQMVVLHPMHTWIIRMHAASHLLLTKLLCRSRCTPALPWLLNLATDLGLVTETHLSRVQVAHMSSVLSSAAAISQVSRRHALI